MTDASADLAMTDVGITIGETTQPALSDHLVGVSNIWERDLPNGHGTTTPRMSAQLSITDPSTRIARTEFVSEDDTIQIGDDRYRVIAVTAGRSAPGWIVVRRVDS